MSNVGHPNGGNGAGDGNGAHAAGTRPEVSLDGAAPPALG